MEPIANMKGPGPELYMLPVVASRYALPDAYEKARAGFAAAQKDYEEGNPGKAGPKFMAVAQLVKAPSPKTTYSEQFAKMRGIAYQDAAIAFEQAGQRAEGRKALTAALQADPENAEVLKKLLSTFS